MKNIRDAQMMGRNSQGVLVTRPLSPHLQIYRWPITMAASICHRATGIALSVGALLLVCWVVTLASSGRSFADLQWFLGTPIGLLLLFGWTLSLAYHLLSGLRHMVWDAGRGLDHPALNPGSYLVFGGAVVLTVLVFAIGLLVWR